MVLLVVALLAAGCAADGEAEDAGDDTTAAIGDGPDADTEDTGADDLDLDADVGTDLDADPDVADDGTPERGQDPDAGAGTGDDVGPETDDEPTEPEIEEEVDHAATGYAVPDDLDDVDAHCVDAVMERILTELSDLMVDALEVEPGPEHINDFDRLGRVGDLAGGPQFLEWITVLDRSASEAEVRDRFVPLEEQAPITWETRVVRTVTEGCIVAIGIYDVSTWLADPLSTDVGVAISLSRFDEASDAATIQDPVTPWRFHDLETATIEGEPIPEDQWDEIEYEDALTTTCDADLEEPRERS